MNWQTLPHFQPLNHLSNFAQWQTFCGHFDRRTHGVCSPLVHGRILIHTAHGMEMRMSGEMVERVAKRIAHLRMCEKQGNDVPCASCRNARGYNDDVGCMALARAAIEAMREPTQQMRLAGVSEWSRPDPTPEHASTMVFNCIWQAMIDEALK